MRSSLCRSSQQRPEQVAPRPVCPVSDRGHEVRDVEEVLVVQVFGDAVLLPGAATHAERESRVLVEAAAVAEGVREVDEDAHDVEILRKLAGRVPAFLV